MMEVVGKGMSGAVKKCYGSRFFMVSVKPAPSTVYTANVGAGMI